MLLLLLLLPNPLGARCRSECSAKFALMLEHGGEAPAYQVPELMTAAVKEALQGKTLTTVGTTLLSLWGT